MTSFRTPRAAVLSTAIALSCLPVAFAAETAGPEPTDLDRVTVNGTRYLPNYTVRQSRSATRTPTPLVDTPQAATVITEELIRDQAISGVNDLLRYVPGAGVAQGEGNRDTPVLRGVSTTADFFVDGIRDDVQYIRDLYNIERVEVLKGPNAMIFGRGGSGGVVNRVVKRAEGVDDGRLSLQYGSWNRRRATADWQTALGERAGLRVNALLEDSESFRDGFALERKGINPGFGMDLSERTRVDVSFEHFQDHRVADRGVTSWQGKPLQTDPSLFLGNPEQSPVDARVNALDATVHHDYSNEVSLRNHFRVADYAKFYQNVFGNGTTQAADGSFVIALAGYNMATDRRGWFNQTDVNWRMRTGAIEHTWMAGAEFGRQDNRNLRMTGSFPGGNSVPLASPRYAGTVLFAQAANDARNQTRADTAAIYLQDQIEFSPRWQAIFGARYDRFDLEMRDLRSGANYRAKDGLWSPRAGLIYKPRQDMSVYASYSVAFQPRGGEQLASLNAGNQALRPEKFVNNEIGFKWDVSDDLALTVAAYQLERTNVAITDPADSTRLLLVDGQRARGVEAGIAGRLTERWQIMGGYAWQQGELLASQSAAALAGNRLAQLPRHSASLWNRFDFNDRFGLGLGAVYRDAIYPSTDNRVEVPGFVRWDAAAFYAVNPRLHLQLNVENLFDKRYYASAHSNNSISPGAPRGAVLTAHIGF